MIARFTSSKCARVDIGEWRTENWYTMLRCDLFSRYTVHCIALR